MGIADMDPMPPERPYAMSEATLRAGLSFLLAGGSRAALACLMAYRVKLREGPDPEQADSSGNFQRLCFARRLYASRRISECDPSERAA